MIRTFWKHLLQLALYLQVLPGIAQLDPVALDQYFEQMVEDWEVPGISVALIEDGKVILSEGYGRLAKSNPSPTDENTLYAIASNTKAFVATAIGKLVEEGHLSWDDKVISILPYLQLYDPWVTAELTVEDLLCHRAGLGTFSGDVLWYKSERSAREALSTLQFLPKAYSFRAGYGYSNLMFIAAGEIIRAVSGMQWDEYVAVHFFQPLGMDRTQTTVTALPELDNVATPHKMVREGDLEIAWTNWDNMGAAGGIISSVADMAKWLQLQLQGGVWQGDTLFSEATQEKLWSYHNNYRVGQSSKARFPDKNFDGYGLGWGIFDWNGEKVISHSGGYDGMYSRVFLVPELNFAGVILTNSMTGIGTYAMYEILERKLGSTPTDWSEMGRQGLYRGFDQRALQFERWSQTQDIKVQPSLSRSAMIGTYHCPLYGALEVVETPSGGLALHFEKAPLLTADLLPWNGDTWHLDWHDTHAWFDFGTVQFTKDNLGHAKGLEFFVPNGDIFFEEINAQKK